MKRKHNTSILWIKSCSIMLAALLICTACGKNTENSGKDNNISSGSSTTSGNITDRQSNTTISSNTQTAPSDTVTASAAQNTRSINTHSKYSGSFRKEKGEDKDVIYLGKPRELEATTETENEDTWESSDEEVATVSNGMVTGWQEGEVTITRNKGKETEKEWDFLVTTFNDGKQVEYSYELGREEITKLIENGEAVLTPEYWQMKLNTFQDVISYLQVRQFQYSEDLPWLATETGSWVWNIPGSVILLENKGYSTVLSDALMYLLGDDFEDSGYIMCRGKNSRIFAYFYEDGNYYILDTRAIMNDFEAGWYDQSYLPVKMGSIEELKDYIFKLIDVKETLALIMTSGIKLDCAPPLCENFQHDSSKVLTEHSVIGLESAIYDKCRILYSNPELDFEIKSIPSEEIPEGIPKVGGSDYYNYD